MLSHSKLTLILHSPLSIVNCSLSIVFFLIYFSFSQKVSAQPTPYYTPPMKLPMAISGNFAELRGGHLHSGVDFRTEGKEGEPVYAVADGYIGRIVIRPDGYGKALYLWHTNNTMSVYAHLRTFTPEVTEWAKKQQYKRESFYLDTELEAGTFSVKQGDLIGYSGNSGRSFGPHLHFEIRDRNQWTLNFIQDGTYKIPDNTLPTAYQLVAYRFDTVQGMAMPKEDNTYSLIVAQKGMLRLGKDTINIPTPAYFGLNMRDQMDGSKNIYGVSRCEMRLNDSLIFSYNMDKFSFDETRYVNAMTDFNKSASKFVRLYVAPGNKLSIYRAVKNQGIISLNRNEVAKVNIILTDDAGNTSQLNFWTKGTDKLSSSKTQLLKGQNIANWNKSNTYEVAGGKFTLPSGALYEPSVFELQTLGPAYGSASPVFLVKQPATPPHRAVSVSIKASIPEDLRSKATIVCMDKKGQKDALNTTYQMPYFTANTRSWGYFFVELDTIAPQITPVNFVPGSRLGANQKRITFKVKDSLSGLKSYAGHIDGEWALFEYNVMNDQMTYEVDPTRVKTGTQHTVTFTATDGVGNKEVFLCELFF